MTVLWVTVDPARCQGHGRCLDVAAEVFGFDDSEGRAYPLAGVCAGRYTERLRLAAEQCPERAIRIGPAPPGADPVAGAGTADERAGAQQGGV